MCKKTWGKIFSVFVAVCLIIVQSMNVNAAGNSGLSADQLNTILNGLDSIVLQLESWGLNDREIIRAGRILESI